jgi:hypothetical protein
MVVGVSGDVEYQVRLEPPPARRWLLIAAASIIRGVSRVFGARVGRGCRKQATARAKYGGSSLRSE